MADSLNNGIKDEQSLNQIFCNKEMLAALLILTPRRIDQLAKLRIVPKAGCNRFELVPAVQAYVSFLQGPAKGAILGEGGDLNERLLNAQVVEREAKARLAQYQADREEGKLLSLEEVSTQWAARYIELKAELLELPRRAAFQFTDPTVRVNVEEEMSAFVHEALERYSREGIRPLKE